jgi:imidazolonepropionase
MWDILYSNANLATMVAGGAPYGAIEDGAIACKDGRIAWLGPLAQLPGKPEKVSHEQIDCNGMWLTPGLGRLPHPPGVRRRPRAANSNMRLQGKSYEDIARAGGGIISTVSATREPTTEELAESCRHSLAACTHCEPTA